MKHLLLSLLIFGFGISGSLGQTIKSLGYNTTNGQVVANTGTNVLTFTNIYGVQVNNLQIGDTNVKTDFYIEDDGLSISVYRTNTETFIGNFGFLDSVRLAVPITFNNTTNAATTRTNLGLGGGITTNRTFVSYNGTNYTTNTVTISNGIITGWTQ